MRGRDVTHTTINTATNTDANPAHVSHARSWNLRILAAATMNTVDMKENQTEHVAWPESTFNAIETPMIPVPAQRIYLKVGFQNR